jgi:hypothetical protein
MCPPKFVNGVNFALVELLPVAKIRETVSLMPVKNKKNSSNFQAKGRGSLFMPGLLKVHMHIYPIELFNRLLETKVTRLGDFSPIGTLFTLGHFKK